MRAAPIAMLMREAKFQEECGSHLKRMLPKTGEDLSTYATAK
jgi:hypothetical protein